MLTNLVSDVPALLDFIGIITKPKLQVRLTLDLDPLHQPLPPPIVVCISFAATTCL